MKGGSAEDVDVELLKAVAQAWYAHSGNPRPSRASAAPGDVDEVAGVGARRAVGGAAPRYRPSRFKLEAAAAAAAPLQSRKSWDFAQSLWDTYELVTVAQKIESSLIIADQLAAAAPRAGAEDGATRGGGGKRARESRRSLRSMFLRSSHRKLEESSS